MTEIVLVYIALNMVSCLMFGIDKRKAIKHRYRISEKTLMGLALLGPIGAIVGMFVFHHKTQKSLFKVGVPFFVVLHVIVLLSTGVVFGEEINPSPWAKVEYDLAVQKGYITEPLKVDLQKNITRQEFVELIMGSYETVMGEVADITLEDNPFLDVESLPLIKAEKIGIVSGTGGKEFRPNDVLNREQMIVILARMNRAIEIRMNEHILRYQDIQLDFADADIVSPWAVESFQIGILNEMITGVGNNLLGPKVLTTREQAIVLNLRLMLRYEGNQNLLAFNKATNETELKIEQPIELKKKGSVSVAILNMRSTPDLTSPDNIIRKLKLNEILEIVETKGEWYQVIASDGLKGYVFTEYVLLIDTSLTVSNPENINELIIYAKQFQGTKYVYGGSSLTSGIDCSGFTKQIYSHFGISLSRSSAGQYTNGTAVTMEELKPGDLLFYGFSGYVSHAAIYIGNNQVIHANTTYGVSITPAFGWLNKPFIGIRRVIF